MKPSRSLLPELDLQLEFPSLSRRQLLRPGPERDRALTLADGACSGHQQYDHHPPLAGIPLVEIARPGIPFWERIGAVRTDMFLGVLRNSDALPFIPQPAPLPYIDHGNDPALGCLADHLHLQPACLSAVKNR